MSLPPNSVFTDLRKRLFSKEAEFTERSIDKRNPIRPYKIGTNVEFNTHMHWIVFDFVNNKIYKKLMDRANLMFDIVTNIYRDENGEPGPTDMKAYLDEQASNAGAMVDCALDKKALVAIFDKSFDPSQEDRMMYSIYQSIIQGKLVTYTDEQIAAVRYGLTPTMNWVWFRKPGAYLSTHIPKRAMSWIRNNPELEFHLWTNMKDYEELKDFFKNADPNQEFLKLIQPHYTDDLYNLVQSFCERNSVSWPDYKYVLDVSDDNHSIVFKTDSVRNVILAERGGWYSDFNDTYCFTPLRYIIDNTSDTRVIIGCDDDEVTNNYLMYAPPAPHNASWCSNTRKSVENCINMCKLFKDTVKCDLVIKLFEKTKAGFCDALENSFTNTICETIAATFNPFQEEFQKIVDEHYRDIHQHYGGKLFTDVFLRVVKPFNDENPIMKRFCEEAKHVRDINFTGGRMMFRRRRMNPVSWNMPGAQTLQPWTPLPTDIAAMRNTPIDHNEIVATLVKAFILKIMEHTNLGVIYLHEKEDYKRRNEPYLDPRMIVPFCYLYGNYTFLTGIAHIGDGTCTGSTWGGKEEDYL
jgi:hypothetical protein